MRTIIALSSLVSLMTIATAATNNTTTSTLKQWRKKLQDSPASLIFDNYTEGVRKSGSKQVNGTDNIFDIIGIWSLRKNESLALLTEVYTTFRPNETLEDDQVQHTVAIAELGYKKSNLIKNDLGLNVWAQAKYGFYPNDKERTAARARGYLQGRLGATKSFGKLTLGTHGRYYKYQGNDYVGPKGETNFRTERYRGYLTASYSLSDKLTASSFFRYQANIDSETKKASESTLFEIAGDYALNEDFTVGSYLDFSPFAARDGQTFAEEFTENFTLGLHMALNIF